MSIRIPGEISGKLKVLNAVGEIPSVEVQVRGDGVLLASKTVEGRVETIIVVLKAVPVFSKMLPITL